MRFYKQFCILAQIMLCCAATKAQVDSRATRETVNLYKNMKAHAPQMLMYGQQHAYLLGFYADGIGEHSDCQHITGENPAVVGYDFVRKDYWTPTGRDNAFHKQIVAHFLRGGINTFSWHADNPSPNATGSGGYRDTTGNPVQGILDPESQTRAKFNARLDDICSFFNNLEAGGVKVPIIWRPFHENVNSGFWWGGNNCTPEEFKQLWHYTYTYMTRSRGVHNLIWAYSPNRRSTEAQYLERYPGDAYIDLIGFDFYGDSESSGYDDKVLQYARVAVKIAESRGKPAAMTESGHQKGYGNTNRTDFFTSVWLDNFKDDPEARNLCYVLTWYSPDFSCYAEGPNAHLYPDFIEFYESPYSIFEDDVPDFYGRFSAAEKR